MFGEVERGKGFSREQDQDLINSLVPFGGSYSEPKGNSSSRDEQSRARPIVFQLARRRETLNVGSEEAE